MVIRVGTAGWSVPRSIAGEFPAEGTSLSRYAARLDAAEINSSFHRSHRPSTWLRWRDSVPDHFRFSVKVPKLITHQRKLVHCEDALEGFLEEAALLGSKLAVLLVQLPPKLAFDAAVAGHFFAALGARSSVPVACEPRHPSWFTEEAELLLQRFTVARVAADPAICAAAAFPGGWRALSYWRLHGSPMVYRSSYLDRIGDYAAKLRVDKAAESWVIFDNTASSAGAGDALALLNALAQ